MRALTNKQILEMERRGANPYEIAKASGLSRTRVRAICKRGETKLHRGPSVCVRRA